MPVLGAIATLLAACGQSGQEGGSGTAAATFLTAATLGDQVVRDASEYLAEPPYATADLANGEQQAVYCRACHSLDAGGARMVGPGLHGFFGTRAGSREGFDYSDALAGADFVWTPRALDAWLAQPGRFLPGNRMIFAGVPKQADRDDLIAYLLQKTTGGAE